jgi:hypothetical protein
MVKVLDNTENVIASFDSWAYAIDVLSRRGYSVNALGAPLDLSVPVQGHIYHVDNSLPRISIILDDYENSYDAI